MSAAIPWGGRFVPAQLLGAVEALALAIHGAPRPAPTPLGQGDAVDRSTLFYRADPRAELAEEMEGLARRMGLQPTGDFEAWVEAPRTRLWTPPGALGPAPLPRYTREIAAFEIPEHLRVVVTTPSLAPFVFSETLERLGLMRVVVGERGEARVCWGQRAPRGIPPELASWLDRGRVRLIEVDPLEVQAGEAEAPGAGALYAAAAALAPELGPGLATALIHGPALPDPPDPQGGRAIGDLWVGPAEEALTPEFAPRQSAAGVRRVLALDLPPEEAPEWAPGLRAWGLEPVLPVAEGTPEDRLAALAPAFPLRAWVGPASPERARLEMKLGRPFLDLDQERPKSRSTA